MKKWFSLGLGIVTATGGFLDAGTIATAGESGTKFALGLVWAIVLATIAIILLVEMVGRFTAVSQKTYAAAIREDLGFRFYLFPLISEIIAESLMLTAELGGMAVGLSLFTGISWHLLFLVAALMVFLMSWRAPFNWIENGPAILGLLTLSFLVAVFALGRPSADLVSTLWRPTIKPGDIADYFYLAAATLGSTISPYMLYFYSSGAREEQWSNKSLLLNRVTAIMGMSFGSIGSLSLVMLSAMVLRPQNMMGGTLDEIGLAMAKPFGVVGPLLFAGVLFITCFGAAMEVLLAISYNIAQGFGWEWGEKKKPVEAARFNLVIICFLLIAVILSSVGMNPLQMALLASTVIALFLPFSLLPFLILLNDAQYMGTKTNGPIMNGALMLILLIAFVVALVSLPLQLLTGGG